MRVEKSKLALSTARLSRRIYTRLKHEQEHQLCLNCLAIVFKYLVILFVVFLLTVIVIGIFFGLMPKKHVPRTFVRFAFPKQKKVAGKAVLKFGPEKETCPRDFRKLRGLLNVTAVLVDLGLEKLVEFEEPRRIFKKRGKQKNFYLDENNYNITNKHGRFDEFWELWHTTNMSFLNISNGMLGRGGQRVVMGGEWRPVSCTSRQKVTVIIPFRANRIPHLRVNLVYLHDILQRQMLDYKIFVVKEDSRTHAEFNKGRILNAGWFLNNFLSTKILN
jgi:hypothetical protein